MSGQENDIIMSVWPSAGEHDRQVECQNACTDDNQHYNGTLCLHRSQPPRLFLFRTTKNCQIIDDPLRLATPRLFTL